MSQTTFNPAPIAPVITRAEFGYSKVLFTLSYSGLNDQDVFGNAVWSSQSSGGGTLSTSTPAGGPCLVSGLLPSSVYNFTLTHYDRFIADAGTSLLEAHFLTLGSTLLNNTSTSGATATPITITSHENISAGIIGGVFGPVIHFYLEGVGTSILLEVQDVATLEWVVAYKDTVTSPGFIELSLAPGTYNVRYSSSFTFSNGIVDLSPTVTYANQVVVSDGSDAFNNFNDIIEGVETNLQDSIDSLTGDVILLDTAVDNMLEDIATLTGDTSSLADSLAGVNTSITNLNDDISDISDELSDLNTTTLTLLDDLKVKVAIEQLSRKETDKQLFNATAAAQSFKQSIEAGLAGLSSAVVEVDPISGQIRNNAFRYTDDKFTSASLLIDGANASINLLTNRVQTTETSLSNAESSIELLAGQIELRATYTEVTETVAGAISAIQPVYSFGFFNSTEGWTAVNGSVSNTAGHLDVVWGVIENTSLNYTAEEYPVITINIERESGTGWDGSLQINTVENGILLYSGKIPDTPEGTAIVRSIDLSGEPSFAGTVTGIRLLLGTSESDIFKINSIVVGKPSAQLQQLEGITAQVNSLGIDLNAVKGSLTSYVTTTYYTDNTVTLGNVSSVLDGEAVIIGLTATKEQLDDNGTITKANTAKTWIDGAESNITSIVTSFNAKPNGVDDKLSDLRGDLTTASQEIDAIEGKISNSVTSISNLEFDSKELAKLQFFAEAEMLKQRQNALEQGSSIALARQELSAKSTDISAVAQELLLLSASTGTRMGQLNAEIQAVNSAITSETEARAQSAFQIRADLSSGLSATNDRLDKVEVDLSGTAASLTSINNAVTNPNTGLSATFTLAGLAKTAADGATSSATTISNKIGHPETGLSATFNLAGLAKTTSDSAISAIGGLQTQVTTVDNRVTSANVLLASTIEQVTGTSEALAALDGAISDPVTGLTAAFTLAGTAKSTADGVVTSMTTISNKVEDPVTGLDATFDLLGLVKKGAEDTAESLLLVKGDVDDELTGLSATFNLVGIAQKAADDAMDAFVGLNAKVIDPLTGLNATFTLAGNAKTDAKKSADATAALKAIVDNEETGLQAAFTAAGSASITANQALQATGTFGAQVSSLTGQVSAASSLATSAQIEAGIATGAVTSLTTRINDEVNGLTATFSLAGSAKTEAGKATTAVAGLTTTVGNLDGALGSAKLLLDSTIDELGIVKSRAFLGVSSTVGGTSVITGVTIDSITRSMEFRADAFRLANTSGDLQMYWDTIRQKWVFNGDLVAANFQTGTSGTRAEMGSKDSFPFWFGSGEKTAANAKMYVDTSGNVVLNDAFVKGRFVTDNGTGVRTEIHDDGTYLVWVGTGPKTDANGVFWIKKDNTGFIKGSFFQGQIIETKVGSASSGTLTNLTATALDHNSAGAPIEIGVTLSTGCSVYNPQIPNQSSRILRADISIYDGGTLLQQYSRFSQSVFDGQVTEWWVDFSTTLVHTTSAGLHNLTATVQYSWSTMPSGTLQVAPNSLNISTFENRLV